MLNKHISICTECSTMHDIMIDSCKFDDITQKHTNILLVENRLVFTHKYAHCQSSKEETKYKVYITQWKHQTIINRNKYSTMYLCK